MSTDVDIRQLAIERGAQPSRRNRHLVTRYLVPSALVIGIISLVVWAARDFIWPPRPVTVVPVLAQRSAMQQAGSVLFQAAGWVQPRPTPIRVAALAPGVVKKLLVVEDQPLKVGETIATLIDEDAKLTVNGVAAKHSLRQAELQQAKAKLAAAITRFEQPVHLSAPLAAATAKLASVDTQLQNLPFQLRRAEANARFAKQDYDGKIASTGAVAQRLIDEAKSMMETSNALVGELKNRKAALDKERLALGQQVEALDRTLKLLADERRARDEAKANVAAAEARLKQAAVELEEAKLRLSRMTIRAPVEGRVYQLLGHPGARIGDGAGMGIMTGHDGSTVITMYRPDRLQVRVDVRFEDIVNVQLGQKVAIKNPALKEPITGKVLFITSLVDLQKNTNEVKVSIDKPLPLFKPEMLVDVTFLAPETRGTNAPETTMRFYVPASLVHSEGDQKWIWVSDQSNGRAIKQVISTGKPSANGMLEVVEGLNVSSRLIVSGTDGLADKARIVVTGEAKDYVPFLPNKSAGKGGP